MDSFAPSSSPSPSRLSHSSDQKPDSSPSPSSLHERLLDPNESSPASQPHAVLPWRPLYLCRSVLAVFTVVFLAIVATVEALYAISNERRGVATGRVNNHYLWTYGPTAYFTLLAAFWGRVEYQSKLFAPWIRLSKGPTESRRGLTLDYVSDSQIAIFFRGIRNKDFDVSIAVLVSILIKAMIIISTGLTTLSWVNVDQQSRPMKTLDMFGDTQLPVLAPLAFCVSKGLIDYNLTYPDGMSSDYAFQTVKPDTLPNRAEVQTTVDALESSFSCQPVDVRLDTENFDKHLPASEDFNGASRDTIEIAFQTPTCGPGDQTMRFYRPQWTCDRPKVRNPGDSCTVTFSRTDSMPCGYQIMLAIFGNITYTYPPEPKKQPYRIELAKSTQVICTATTNITKVHVTYNGTHPTSIRRSAIPGRHLGMENTRQILASSYGSHFQRNDRSKPVSFDLSGVTVDTDSIMRNALKMQNNLTPNISAAALFEPESLEGTFTRYMKQCNAVVVKQYMMVKGEADITGSITGNDTRLLIQLSATQWIAGLSAICALLTGAAMFFVPSRGILPCSPTTPLGLASLVLHSHKLLTVLRHSAHTDGASLHRLLRSSRWESDMTLGHRSPQAHFVIHDSSESRSGEKAVVHMPQDTKSEPKPPLFLRPVAQIAAGLILVVAIVILETLLQQSNRNNGLRDVDDDKYIHYAWTTIPAAIFGLISILFSCMDFNTRSLAPYTSLERSTPVEMLPTLEFLDGLIPRVLYRELKVRNLGAFLMTVTFLVASLFATFSASLFHLLPATTRGDAQLQVIGLPNSLPDYNTEEAGVINSLTLQANLTFPKFTYDNLIFPELSASIPGASTVSINVKVPALRAKMDCRTYNSDDIRVNYTYANISGNALSSDMDTLRASMKGEECITNPTPLNSSNVTSLYNIKTLLSPTLKGYLGVAATRNQNSSGCSDLLYLWGYADPWNGNTSHPIKHIAAMGCNVSYEAIDVDTTFAGPDLRIDPAHPPIPDEHTARPVRLAANPPSRYGIYNGLQPFHTRSRDNGDSRDSFFSILTSSAWAIPHSYLNHTSDNLAVTKAIQFQHGIIEAQIISMNKIPPSNPNAVNLGNDASTIPTTYEATITTTDENRLRVEQDVSSTRILEGLLGAVLVLFILSRVFTPKSDALMCEPTTIASTAALVAGGNLLELMPEDAAWMSGGDVLAGFPSGVRFRVGWSEMLAQAESDGGGEEGGDGGGDGDGVSLVGDTGMEVKTVERFGIVAVFDQT